MEVLSFISSYCFVATERHSRPGTVSSSGPHGPLPAIQAQICTLRAPVSSTPTGFSEFLLRPVHSSDEKRAGTRGLCGGSGQQRRMIWHLDPASPFESSAASVKTLPSCMWIAPPRRNRLHRRPTDLPFGAFRFRDERLGTTTAGQSVASGLLNWRRMRRIDWGPPSLLSAPAPHQTVWLVLATIRREFGAGLSTAPPVIASEAAGGPRATSRGVRSEYRWSPPTSWSGPERGLKRSGRI